MAADKELRKLAEQLRDAIAAGDLAETARLFALIDERADQPDNHSDTTQQAGPDA